MIFTKAVQGKEEPQEVSYADVILLSVKHYPSD